MRVLFIFGTRPEAIKLAPVIKEAEKSELLESLVLVTGQHREMLDQALGLFGIEPDADLDMMGKGSDLTEIGARFLQGIGKALVGIRPDYVIVQGDTTTTLMASMAAFYQGIPIAHVEAGLRSYDNYQPFPEEVNRRLVSVLARLHFVATERAKKNLLREGVAPENIFLTGNPIIDSLMSIISENGRYKKNLPKTNGGPLVLVTAHRRENWGRPLKNICEAINLLVDCHSDLEIVFPVHLNPVVRQEILTVIKAKDRVYLVDPFDYATFIALMNRCSLILTDSGGIQEEAISLGKSVLVMREVTERQEAVEVGAAELVGTDPKVIVSTASKYLENKNGHKNPVNNPFGDGRAAKRIIRILERIDSGDVSGLEKTGDEMEIII